MRGDSAYRGWESVLLVGGMLLLLAIGSGMVEPGGVAARDPGSVGSSTDPAVAPRHPPAVSIGTPRSAAVGAEGDEDFLIYLPLVLRHEPFDGPWEREDNDSYLQANGLLLSGVEYYGYPDDARDFFSFYTESPAVISVELSDHSAEAVQLQLFYGVASDENRVVYDASAPFRIDYNGQAGWYYVCICTVPGDDTTTPYTVRVTYDEPTPTPTNTATPTATSTSTPTGTTTPTSTPSGTQNLILNPGFEGLTCAPDSDPGWCDDNWTRDTFNGEMWTEIYTPQGWVTFWSEGANPSDPGGRYGRPECKVIPNVAPFIGPPARIRSGQYAIQQFGFYRAIDSGVYQVVGGLTPHASVQAEAHAHAWSCNDGGPLSCGDEWNMLFRVGVDPDGGTDPWSPNIVWVSAYSYDLYRLIGSVRAEVGDAGVVTVFLRATAKWPFKHNDVYWDDASLVVLSD